MRFCVNSFPWEKGSKSTRQDSNTGWEAVLLRYHELGGEILTLGADAHAPEHVAYAFDRLPQILRHAGFRYFTVFTGRKPDFLPLPE